MKCVLVIDGKQIGECSPTYRESDDCKSYIFRLNGYEVHVKRSKIDKFVYDEVNGLGIQYIKTK